MSNQNAGADRQSCPWCQLWQAAYLASRIEWRQYRSGLGVLEHVPLALKWLGHQLLGHLATRETDCPGCLRSAEIQRGNVLGQQQVAWRAEMYEQNPVMRQFMRAGPGDTFGEAGETAEPWRTWKVGTVLKHKNPNDPRTFTVMDFDTDEDKRWAWGFGYREQSSVGTDGEGHS